MAGPTSQRLPNEDWGPLAGLPGNPIMWVLIGSELAVFGAAFVAFGVARLGEPGVFAEAQGSLDRLAGALNTMVLLTSGFCAALAVRFSARNRPNPTRAALVAASLLGLVFLGVKSLEYADKIDAGVSVETNTFFMFYYLTTGFHALHVVFGIVLLAIVAVRPTLESVITVTAFWHMVDLIWVVLFAVIYLVR